MKSRIRAQIVATSRRTIEPATLLVPTLALMLLCACQRAAAQTEADIAAVMPGADRFEEPEGTPPVRSAYSGDQLIGYVFRTVDWPPERPGYSGPIRALVGMDLSGQITGVRVIDYVESHRSSLGDFLRRSGVQEQFAGKHIADPFVVREDVDGVTSATISVRAMARGVRNAARRVAEAHLETTPAAGGSVDDPASLTWFELLETGVAARMDVSDAAGRARIVLAHLMNDQFAERFIGAAAMGMTQRAQAAREGGAHVFAYAVDGSSLRYFARTGWSVVQDGDTVEVAEADVMSFGLASDGMLHVEVGTGGAILVDRLIDLERPFTFVFSPDSARAPFEVEYLTLVASSPDVASGPASAPGESLEPSPEAGPGGFPLEAGAEDTAAAEGRTAEGTAGVGEPSAPIESADSSASSAARTVVSDARSGPDPNSRPFSDVDYEETELARLLAGTSWARVGATLLFLLLASLAFGLKSRFVGWTALTVTLLFLGFVDGGFLSVSHITSVLWTGASVLGSDVPLTLMILFVLASTLLYGRVFCGFLCPFGALQEFLARFVPRRFQLRVPWPLHTRALYLKYGILAAILIPAALGVRASIYQYFEPFGTVFYQSPSLILWVIAIAFIVASALIPRFYCRYACPLGAALAIGSLLSLKRIRRVRQCDHCVVCEQACPTGAIRGPAIDFKECVRCNVCELKLNEKAGACRHSVAEVQSRLVQINEA